MVETGFARDPHQFAVLLGFGATAVYLRISTQASFDEVMMYRTCCKCCVCWQQTLTDIFIFARDPHQFAVLLGFGATAVYPYLAYDVINDLIAKGRRPVLMR
jgi:hypothetical protein